MAVDLQPGGPATAGAGSPATPSLEGLGQAVGSGNGTDHGANLDATAFQALASAADNHDTINTYCQALVPGSHKTKESKNPKDPKQDEPSDGGQQGQGSPPTSTSSGGQGQAGPPGTSPSSNG